MEFFIIGITAFVAAGVTVLSGFGVGTVLMPMFALFFPLEVAIAVTAVIHGVNRLPHIFWKKSMVERELIIRFGFPAMGAAVAGAVLLVILAEMKQWAIFPIGQMTAVITPLKLILAILILGFGILEMRSETRTAHYPKSYQPLGGLLSGFFGGLSGHQGMLRTAFLSRGSLSASVYKNSTAVISLLVDAVRFLIYAISMAWFANEVVCYSFSQWLLVATGLGASLGGIALGNYLTLKVNVRMLKYVAGIFIIAVALGLGVGLI
ncbi:MAG: TSUP family transporter [candidate division FCPU426 bacterium]